MDGRGNSIAAAATISKKRTSRKLYSDKEHGNQKYSLATEKTGGNKELYLACSCFCVLLMLYLRLFDYGASLCFSSSLLQFQLMIIIKILQEANNIRGGAYLTNGMVMVDDSIDAEYKLNLMVKKKLLI